MRYDSDHFSRFLRINRADLRITQKELAEMVGTTQGTISAYERGICAPPFPIAVKLAEVFGCELDDLVVVD